MEILFAIALVIGAVCFTAWRARAAADPASSRPITPSSTLGESRMRQEIDAAVADDYYRRGATIPELQRLNSLTRADHVPPAPTGRGGTAWSPRTRQFEVAGEWYRATNLRALISKHAQLSESGAEIRLSASLVPDPANPHDRQAVAVFVDGLHVGYMERSDASRFHGPIRALPGGELTVLSRQWVRATDQETWARVTLSLPEPDQLACPNPPDARSVLLPPGSTIQVTREDQHMDHLTGLLTRYGNEVVVAASMRALSDKRPRSSVEVVAVDIDEQQVGVLSPTQTANFLPLVQRASSEGVRLCCRASLRGNSLKADVALPARKAHELSESELEELFRPPS